MDIIFSQIFDLLTKTPGTVIYHLTLAFSITAALQSLLAARRSSAYPYTGRMILGLSLALLGQIVLFFSSALGWQNLADAQAFLPPLDRAVTAFSLLWIIWVWCFPRPARAVDILQGLLSLGMVVFFLFSLTNWQSQALDAGFNFSWLDYAWLGVSIFLIVIGIFALLFRQPGFWELGLVFLLVNLAGYVAHLLGITAGDEFPAAVRLAQLCAYPLLPFLVQRLMVYSVSSTAQEPKKSAEAEYPKIDRRRYTADPRAVRAWLGVASQNDPAHIPAAITRAISQTMVADMCFLVTPPTAGGDVVLHSGFDLIREEELPGASLDINRIPVVANAVQRGRPLRLASEGDTIPPDLRVIGDALGLTQPGNLLMIPLMIAQKPWGGLLLLSPYSNRVWSLEDQSFLGGSTEIIVEILQLASRSRLTTAGDTPFQQELRDSHARLEALKQENQELLAELERLKQVTQSAVDIEALIALQQESQKLIAELQEENDRLRRQPTQESAHKIVSPMQEAQLTGELRLTLEELAHAQNGLAQANIKILQLEQQISGRAPHLNGEEVEVLASIAQELRQPLASIMGYTDLLLSESVGILGALQRKFLERVKVSTERMRSLLDDMMNTITGKEELRPANRNPVSLDDIIDHAIADTSAQLKERNITLQVDLPDEFPQVYADQDALQQILVHLLQNAGSVTPTDGIISLRLRTEEKPDDLYLLLQVSDRGGGISTEDLPRVFARRYRADNVLIQGIGDTGVGLSITHTLVEAQGGRIWVDSQQGQGATFSVLLPAGPQPLDANQKSTTRSP